MTRPLRDLLATPDESAVRRTWNAIEERRRAPRGFPWRFPIAALAIAATVVLAIQVWPSGSSTSGALAVADGSELGGILATTSAPRTIALADGSELALAPDTQLAVGENTAERLYFVLARGHADLSVKPSKARRWTIDTGVATVEPTIDAGGARLAIDRSADRVAIRATEGRVRIASEQLTPPVRILAAGEHVEIPIVRTALLDTKATAGAPSSTPTDPADASSATTPSSSATAATTTAASTPSNTETAKNGATSAPSNAATTAPSTTKTGSPSTASTTAKTTAASAPSNAETAKNGATSAPSNAATTAPSATIANTSAATPSNAATTAKSDAASAPANTATTAAQPTTWRTLAARGEHAAAYNLLGAGGVARETATLTTVDELVALADLARLSGHPKDAVAPLRRAADLGAAGSAVAGYSLGKLLLDRLADPSGAAVAIEAAISRGLPLTLDEPAHARLVEAHARTGNTPGAARWAATYEQRYPQGRNLDQVRRWARPR